MNSGSTVKIGSMNKTHTNHTNNNNNNNNNSNGRNKNEDENWLGMTNNELDGSFLLDNEEIDSK